MNRAFWFASAARGVKDERRRIGAGRNWKNPAQGLSWRRTQVEHIDTWDLIQIAFGATSYRHHVFKGLQGIPCVCQECIAEFSFDDDNPGSTIVQNCHLYVPA